MAASGIEFTSTKFSVPAANELGATRRPLINVSVAEGPMPLKLAADWPAGVEVDVPPLSEVENVPLPPLNTDKSLSNS